MSMNLDEAIEFIVAKVELLAEHASSPEQKEAYRKTAQGLERLWSQPRLSLQQLRSLDGEMLELRMKHSLPPAVVKAVREKLVARFKTSRLRPPDRAVARRVLKRGAIADLEEYYQVREFVSCVDNIEAIGEENYGILDGLLETYDGPGDEMAEPAPIPAAEGAEKVSRRRAPPPFDFELPADEKLCPPETPLETRVAFLREKFAQVMAATSFPDDRGTLANQLTRGIEFALGPQTPEDGRGAALEFGEHEAEFFAGYGVSGVQHAAIERALEERFGFRRLGRSAPSRLARALATGEAGGWRDRLIVERFIYHHPHQTLFSRAEIARVNKLLKQS